MNKKYTGSIVLGLNDALVELTGALAGLTFALRNSNLIALTGIIVGFAAALSMGASEYLSSKEDAASGKRRNTKRPLRKAFYTGISYLITVSVLVAPFMFIEDAVKALSVTLLLSIIIIGFYTYFISTIKSMPFWKRFGQMALISLSVALISFLVGVLLRSYFGISI